MQNLHRAQENQGTETEESVKDAQNQVRNCHPVRRLHPKLP